MDYGKYRLMMLSNHQSSVWTIMNFGGWIDTNQRHAAWWSYPNSWTILFILGHRVTLTAMRKVWLPGRNCWFADLLVFPNPWNYPLIISNYPLGWSDCSEDTRFISSHHRLCSRENTRPKLSSWEDADDGGWNLKPIFSLFGARICVPGKVRISTGNAHWPTSTQG